MHRANLCAVLYCQINQTSQKFNTIQNYIPSQASFTFTSLDVPACRRSTQLAMWTADIAGGVESIMGFSLSLQEPCPCSSIQFCPNCAWLQGLKKRLGYPGWRIPEEGAPPTRLWGSYHPCRGKIFLWSWHVLLHAPVRNPSPVICKSFKYTN